MCRHSRLVSHVKLRMEQRQFCSPNGTPISLVGCVDVAGFSLPLYHGLPVDFLGEFPRLLATVKLSPLF